MPGVGDEFISFLKNGRLDIDALEQAMKRMTAVNVDPGVLPGMQQEADALQKEGDLPDGEEDVLAAEWYKQQQQHPQEQQQQPGGLNLNPTPPWAADAAAAEVAGAAAAPTGAAAAATAGSGTAAAPPGSSIAGVASAQAPAATGSPQAAGAVPAPVAGGVLPSSTRTAQPKSSTTAGAAAKVGGHSMATLDVAGASGAGTAIIAKRSHASRRGATYAELVQPVHGQDEWALFRRLIRSCTTRKGINFQRLGDLWDEEMERNPSLTPKSVSVLRAAEKEYSKYLALKRSLHDMQESESAAAAATTSAAGAAGVPAVGRSAASAGNSLGPAVPSTAVAGGSAAGGVSTAWLLVLAC